MLDTEDQITALQSKTVKAALSAVIINVATLAAIFTGKTFDITAIQHVVDYYLPILANFASIYYGWKAIKGRVEATQTIVKKDK